MAQFNINNHISDGKALEWLALNDNGQSVQDVESEVIQAAIGKFGPSVYFDKWESVRRGEYVMVKLFPGVSRAF